MINLHFSHINILFNFCFLVTLLFYFIFYCSSSIVVSISPTTLPCLTDPLYIINLYVFKDKLTLEVILNTDFIQLCKDQLCIKTLNSKLYFISPILKLNFWIKYFTTKIRSSKNPTVLKKICIMFIILLCQFFMEDSLAFIIIKNMTVDSCFIWSRFWIQDNPRRIFIKTVKITTTSDI